MKNNIAHRQNGDESSVEKLLSERPSFSIRLRIIVAFVLAFLFSFGIAVTSMVFVLRVDARQEFLKQARNFSFEIEEARRYEKNFFLYGAKGDLYDALNNINAASNILQNTATELGSMLKRAEFDTLTSNLNNYSRLLNQLASENVGTDAGDSETEPSIEEQLRRYGHKILLLASDLEGKEREKARSTAHTFTLVAIFALVVNLIAMVYMASELPRQILQPLGRAVDYTQRIAEGDFSPITPQRPYRDEFSNLAIAFNRMIRELKEKQEQLVQSRKMAAIGTLTSGIAHELNNPLNNISITVEALLDGLDDYTEEQKKKMLNDCFIEVERASGTVRNLLDFTREGRPKSQPIDVVELVKSGLSLVNNELSLTHIEVETDFDAGLPHILGDFRNLQQVFLNLFLNSIQAMPEGGRLMIQARPEKGKYVRVDVTDNGCGISTDDLPKIFDPFFTTKEEGKGTGLGLSVSYSIIQKSGGNIGVDSEVGKGTTFHIDLPVDVKNT
jgi:signal transduction histidine kinase